MTDMVQKLALGVEFNWLETTEKFVNDMLLYNLNEHVIGVNINKSQMIWRGKFSENLWQSEWYYLTLIIYAFIRIFGHTKIYFLHTHIYLMI